jgi:hypothetical protein
MRKRELWSAAILSLFGLIAVWESLRLSLGEAGRPGPGFFPFYLALGFCIVSLALLVQALLAWNRNDKLPEGSMEPRGTWKVAWILLALFLYAFAFEAVGFLLATFFIMLFLFRAVESLGWPSAIGGSVASSLLSYVMFKWWLQVQLPAGPWGL